MMTKRINNSNKGCCGSLCCTKIEHFNVTLGNTEILRDVNLHIHCGELTAIIGPNGAGKSTLFKSLLGEIPHGGSIKFVSASNHQAEKPIIGYVPQYLSFDLSTPTSVYDFFAAAISKFPVWLRSKASLKKDILNSLKKVQAEKLIDRKMGALSGGELQRILLALALTPVPNILLLDEPVSGIDHNGLELFYKTLIDVKQNYDLSIILISHDLDMVFRYADRVVLLNKTVLANGTPSEVSRNAQTIKTFGLNWYKGGDAKNA